MRPLLSLGPVFFNWDPESWRDFYFRIADEVPIDTVYVGEAVCAKRMPFFAPHVDAAIDRLQRGGKRVILSSLALIASERDAAAMRELAASDGLPIEVNDIGLVPALSGKPFHLGPFINAYNPSTLAYLAGLGARLACLPPELPASSIASLAEAPPLELEVFAFGRLPLAVSARCFHARAHHLHKDGCQFVCARDPNGLAIETLDGDPFLVINGTQTLSYTCCNLIGDLDWLVAAGVDRFRLSPLAFDMVAVARIFRDTLDARLGAAEALASLAEIAGGLAFSNGFLHGEEGRRFRSLRRPDIE